MRLAVLMAVLWMLSPVASAQDKLQKPPIAAKVESLQFPAWVDRAGVKGSIKAGWALYAGDRISTGPTGRLVMTMVGGAKVQFGPNTTATFTSVDLSNVEGQEASLFRLDSGVFSLTSDAVSQERGTSIEVGTGIVVAVLGGQLLGRSGDGLDQVGLIDGVIEVSGPKMKKGRMNRAETVMTVPRNGKAQPVSPLSADRIAAWLGQTEPDANRPALAADGVWDVSIASGYNRKQLEGLACRVQERGYPAEMYPVREPGKQVWYRVVVRRFASQKDATSFIRTAQGLGSKTAWVLLPQT